jgi:hypothetical protein
MADEVGTLEDAIARSVALAAGAAPRSSRPASGFLDAQVEARMRERERATSWRSLRDVGQVDLEVETRLRARERAMR